MKEKLGKECVAEEIRISGSLLRGCRVGFEAGGTGPPFVGRPVVETAPVAIFGDPPGIRVGQIEAGRSEEHTSELQSLMRISYAVFCLKKTKITERQIYY